MPAGILWGFVDLFAFQLSIRTIESKKVNLQSDVWCSVPNETDCSLTDVDVVNVIAVPMVLKCCGEFIEEYGIVDGIYRLSGVTSNIQKLRWVHSQTSINRSVVIARVLALSLNTFLLSIYLKLFKSIVQSRLVVGFQSLCKSFACIIAQWFITDQCNRLKVSSPYFPSIRQFFTIMKRIPPWTTTMWTGRHVPSTC